MDKMIVAKFRSKCPTCTAYVLGGSWCLWDGKVAKCEGCAKRSGWSKSQGFGKVYWYAPGYSQSAVNAERVSVEKIVHGMWKSGMSIDQIAAVALIPADVVRSLVSATAPK
jgi:uncharacterized protein YraI